MSYHRSSTSILSSIDKDYIEEGRGDIYKWGETRSTKRRGVHGWAYAFKKRFIDKSILRSFLNNLTVSLLIQLILSGLCTYTCQRLDLYLDVHIALFVSPIIFPLAFSINADFQRREHVLEDLALFKGGLIVLFFCHRDWHKPSGLSQEFLKAVTNKLKGLILNVKEYLLTENEVKRSFILQVIYEDFSDISQMNEKMRVALPYSASLIQRVIHCHNLMFWAFERLRVIREYRSPRGIRSFTKVFIFVMPLLLSPYYVFVGRSSGNLWGPYYISLISTFVFGTLQGVQDVLDDPFDGISEDDVNLGSLEDWTAHSLLVNRTYTVGRFTVTASVSEKKEEPKKEMVTIDTKNLPGRSVSFREKVNAPLRSILRRASHRPDMHHEKPDTLSSISENDLGTLFPEMALRLNTMKEKGLTGSTTILPGFHVKENPEEKDDSNENTLSNSVRRSLSDMTSDNVGTRRRAYRAKNVSFSMDVDDESSITSPERLSELSLQATDSLPLLRDSNDSASLEQNRELSKELLQSLKKFEKSSGVNRISQKQTTLPNDNMPTSLASLFPNSLQDVEMPKKQEKNQDDDQSPLCDNTQKSHFGKTNLGMSSSMTSFQDDNTTSKPVEDQMKISRFSIMKPSSNSQPDDVLKPQNENKTSRFSVNALPSNASKDEEKASRFSVISPAEDSTVKTTVSKNPHDNTIKERASSFWDFSSEDSVDAKPNETKVPSRSSSVEDVLRSLKDHKGEVYI